MHSRRQNTRLSSHTSLSLVSPNHPICTSHPSFPISVFPLFPFLLLSDGFRLATTRFKPTAHTLFDIAARLPAGQIPEPLSASLYARVAVNKGNPTRDIESAPGKISLNVWIHLNKFRSKQTNRVDFTTEKWIVFK